MSFHGSTTRNWTPGLVQSAREDVCNKFFNNVIRMK